MSSRSSRVASFALAAFLAVSVAACGARGPRPKGSHPEFVQYTLVGYDDGAFRKGRLREPTVVDGFLARDWVRRFPDGRVEYLRLAEPATVAGHAVPEGTHLFYDAAGHVKIVALSENTWIDGQLCKGGGKIHTGLYPSGRLRSFFAPEDVEIDGVLCESSVFHPVRLHENGRLAACRLAADVELAGVSVQRGTEIELDDAGALVARR